MAAIAGVSVASPPTPPRPYHEYVTEPMESALYQDYPTPEDIDQICAMSRSWRIPPLDVYERECQQGGSGYSFCRLSPPQISTITCPQMKSATADVYAAKPQQMGIDPAVIDHLKSVSVFCSLVTVSGDAQMLGMLFMQLCERAPPMDKIVAILPNYREMVQDSANLCDIRPTSYAEFLSTVRSKCSAWSGLLDTICSNNQELCMAIFGTY